MSGPVCPLCYQPGERDGKAGGKPLYFCKSCCVGYQAEPLQGRREAPGKR